MNPSEVYQNRIIGPGTLHSIFIYQQPPLVRFTDGKFRSKFMHLLESIEKIEDSKVKMTAVKNQKGLDLKFINKAFHDIVANRAMEMTLNTLIVTRTGPPKLMTYEENGYCPVVPIPKKISMAKIILLKVKYR